MGSKELTAEKVRQVLNKQPYIVAGTACEWAATAQKYQQDIRDGCGYADEDTVAVSQYSPKKEGWFEPTRYWDIPQGCPDGEIILDEILLHVEEFEKTQ